MKMRRITYILAIIAAPSLACVAQPLNHGANQESAIPNLIPVRVEISADGVVWNTVYNQTPAERTPLTITLAALAETRFIRVTTPKANGKNEMPVISIESR